MSNDFQKSPLIFLLLCALPSMYAMEKQSNINNSVKDASTTNFRKFTRDIDKKFYNAAITAINNKFSKKEDLEIIKQCLADGANIDLKLTKHEVTLLMFAVNFKNGDMVDYLLRRGADVNVCAPHNGLSLLRTLFKVTPQSETLNMQIVESLLKHKANPNGGRNWNEVPLFYAIHDRHNDAVKLLIKYKADVNVRNSHDCALLQEAIVQENFDATKELREAGAVLHNMDPKSNTALHYMTVKQDDKIKNFIKCICTDSCDKADEFSKQTIVGTLLTFKKLNERSGFPKICEDLQFYVLSKFSVACLYGNRGFYDILLKKNYDFVLPRVYKHVKLLEETSAIQNKDNRTALQLLHSNYAQNQAHIKNVERYFDPKLIQKGWEDLIKVFPHTSLVSEDNVARIVHDSYMSFIDEK